MSDPTMNCLINQEQYKFLNTERAALDMYNATNSCKNLDKNYVAGMANIFVLIYNQPRPNVNCNTCIAAMLKPLLHQIHQFEKKKRV